MKIKWFKRKYVYIGFPLLFFLCIGIYVFHLWYSYENEPVGKLSSSGLTINGITYQAELNAYPEQVAHCFGHTQDGISICAIEGEDSKDYVSIIGEMLGGTYRRKSMPAPKFAVSDVSRVSSNKHVSKDPTILKEVVRDLHSKNSQSVQALMKAKGNELYNLDVRLKSYPGLIFPFMLVRHGKHMYFETNMQLNTFLNIDGTALERWILKINAEK